MASEDSWVPALIATAGGAAGKAAPSLVMAMKYGVRLPLPGEGDTATRWAVLAAVSEQDLTAGRVLEAHCDALAIMAEAGLQTPSGSWGVFAAESPDSRLDAHCVDGRWRVHGTKPWCSLGGQLDFALVTAHVGAERGLFSVDLRSPTVRVDSPDGWVARGLREVPSGPVHFAGTAATPVGEPGWYLSRPGFAWGGIGVAACWYGGARALLNALIESRRSRDDLFAASVGAVDVALHSCAGVLADAAHRVDSGEASGAAGDLLAVRVRSVVASAVEQALSQTGHALGPAPLAFDEAYARRTADLQIYIRQHHAERDLATLGHVILRTGSVDQ